VCVCFFFFTFCTTSALNICHFENNWARYDKKNVQWCACKVSAILSYFKESYFLDRFTTNTQIPNFMKICPQGAAFHANRRTDRQTDVTKLTVAFIVVWRTRLKTGRLVSHTCRDTVLIHCENRTKNTVALWQNPLIRSLQARSNPFLKIRRSARRRYPGAYFTLFYMGNVIMRSDGRPNRPVSLLKRN